MSKKKVTAPVTYNPGKGRPKEHLAYLNWQEMQELQRINGGNVERGPRGLPSFADDSASSKGVSRGGQGAVGSGSTKTSTGSVSKSGSSSKTTSSNKSGSTGGGGAGRDSSRGLGVGAGGSAIGRGGDAGAKGGVGGQKSSTQKAGMNARDAQFKQIAESTRASSALKKSPAANTDLSKGGIKTLNVGPMGTPVKVKSGILGGQIKGAISRTADAPVKSPMSGQGASFNSALDARIDTFQRINDARLATKKVFEGTTPRAPQGVFGPRVPAGTGYLRTATMPGMITTGMTSPYSGVAPPRFNAEQTLRAYEAAKVDAAKDQSRVPTTSPTLPSLTRPAYGETGLPSLNRPAYEAAGLASLARPAYETGYSPISITRPGETVMVGKTKPSLRLDEKPPYAGAEKVLSVESLPSVPRPGYTRVTNIFATNPRKLTKDLREVINEGYEKFRPGMEDTAFGVPGPETPTTDYVDDGTVTRSLKSDDVYGPKFVDPAIQEEMRKQDKLNRAGIRVAKAVTGPVGRAFSVADTLRKVFTGKTTAEATADLKRAYMQASSAQRAELEKTYPNLTKFAADAGIEPQLPMSNYTDWSRANRLAETSGRGDVREQGISGGIADITSTAGTGATPSGTSSTASTASARPYIYYEWDLGINVPSPGEPKYTEYQKYLKERADSQKALGLV